MTFMVPPDLFGPHIKECASRDMPLPTNAKAEIVPYDIIRTLVRCGVVFSLSVGACMFFR